MKKLIAIILAVFMLCTVCIMAENSGTDEPAEDEPTEAELQDQEVIPENNVTELNTGSAIIRFGFADNERGAMRIESGMFEGPAGFTFGGEGMRIYLGIAYVNQGSLTAVENSIYESVENVSVKYEGQDILNNGIQTSEGYAPFGENVPTTYFTFTTKEGVKGEGDLTLEFDVTINAKLYHVICTRHISSYVKKDVYINLSKDGFSVDTFNDIFSSEQNFDTYCADNNITVNANTDIWVMLPSKTTVNGTFIIDCGLSQEKYNSITFTTSIGPDDPKSNRFTVSGGIKVISGNPNFSEINLIADENYKIDDINTIGLYAVSDSVSGYNIPADLGYLMNIDFTGFDYGTYFKGCSASQIISTLFERCETGIYLDAFQTFVGGTSRKVVFNNCTTGIEIVSYAPGAYYLDTADFEFYNNGEPGTFADYKVHNNEPYTLIGHYYGKVMTDGKTEANFRSPVVVKAGTETHQLAVNPCLKYPESDTWGIAEGDGLITRVIYGQGNVKKIRNSDLMSGTKVDIELVGSDKKSVNGMLSFGGNQ